MASGDRRGATRLAHISLGVAAVCFMFALVWVGRIAATGPQMAGAPVGPQVGGALPAPPRYAWARHRRTLVLAIRLGCPYCLASVPFYRELTARPLVRTHLLAIFPDSKGAAEEYLKAQRLPLDFRSKVDFRRFHVQGTPTLLLVDSRGRVLFYWVGELNAAGRREVYNFLGTPTHRAARPGQGLLAAVR